jgi:hypothetical protein
VLAEKYKLCLNNKNIEGTFKYGISWLGLSAS